VAAGTWGIFGALYVVMQTGAVVPNVPFQNEGSWSAVDSLPTNPIAAALLPNGNVLMWSSNAELTFEGDIGSTPSQTDVTVFNPSTGQVVSHQFVNSMMADMFCPGTAYLRDGTLLVNGGSSSPKTSIYNFTTNTWSAGAFMNIDRAYNGSVMLPTGEVLTLGGSWAGSSTTEKIGEVWSPSTGAWSLRTGIPAKPVTGPDPADSPNVYRGDNHLWLFATQGGYVFHAGPSAPMHWITTSGIGSIFSPMTTSGTAGLTFPAGNRGDDAYSMNGKAVMYDIGKIFKTGGAPAYGGANATTSTYVIDLNPALTDPLHQSVVVTKTAPMNYPRAFANAVVLPTGKVFVVGGNTYANPFDDSTAVLVPELWDPVRQTFTVLPPMQTPREYHSTALLLPDGRVFVGGGGQCGGCSTNHLNAEIFSPPYLFNSNGTQASQPNIVSAPSTAGLGTNISVSTNTPVSAFAIMRLSSVTHTTDNDQRRVPLVISSSSGNSYSLQVPRDPGVVPPGYYMLFAINSQGTPSIATIIKFG
jgi:galactose oxidase